jgi:hypothetical protein
MAAFVFSLVGGAITVIFGPLVSLFYVTPAEAFLSQVFPVGQSETGVLLFATLHYAAGAACGAMIIVGADLQYSGEKSKVERGSRLVMAFVLASGPFTYFGVGAGGTLALVGAVLGLGWKGDSSSRP